MMILEKLVSDCPNTGEYCKKDKEGKQYCDLILPCNTDKLNCKYLGEEKKFELDDENEYWAGFGESLCECKRKK